MKIGPSTLNLAKILSSPKPNAASSSRSSGITSDTLVGRSNEGGRLDAR